MSSSSLKKGHCLSEIWWQLLSLQSFWYLLIRACGTLISSLWANWELPRDLKCAAVVVVVVVVAGFGYGCGCGCGCGCGWCCWCCCWCCCCCCCCCCCSWCCCCSDFCCNFALAIIAWFVVKIVVVYDPILNNDQHANNFAQAIVS